MDTKEVLKMGADFTAAKEKVKGELVARSQNIIAELYTLGYTFEIVEKDAKPKIGRPKKEKTNGTV